MRFVDVEPEDPRLVTEVFAVLAELRTEYVDDLVTSASHRGRGIGGALLGELVQRARQAGCRAIDLDSALHRSDAHRFYLREGMPIISFHFGRTLDWGPGPPE